MVDNDCSATYIDYKNTGYFSKIALDYIEQSNSLNAFIQHPISPKGIENSIKARADFPQHNRTVLVQELQKQYAETSATNIVEQNILALNNANTFTITTAHQPNILGGPLYLIYKILHVVKISQELNQQHPNKHFVPTFYMGSEDADLDELNHINIYNQKYTWHTNQTGAVGRMLVDNALIELINEMNGRIGVESFGEEWIKILQSFYTQGKQIQQATFDFINHVFGKYGVLVIIPDNANLKKLFEPVIVKELEEQFSHKAVSASIAALTAANYKVQTSGRDINLFYLIENKRERIEWENDCYKIKALGLQFTKVEMIAEVKTHPERISGNVVLRGPFQETILPNIIFVGGGGELAYWLEMKKVYEAVSIPYPMLLLRNSFVLLNEKQSSTIQKLDLPVAAFFLKEFEILNKKIEQNNEQVSLQSEIDSLQNIYQSISTKTEKIDSTLVKHIEALHKSAYKKIIALEKKIAAAQRKRLTVESSQINRLKQTLFPQNSLQERTENIAEFYAKQGPAIFDKLLQYSLTFESRFVALSV